MNDANQISPVARFAGDARYVELAHAVGVAPLLALTDTLYHALAICLVFVTLQCTLLVTVRLLARLVPRQVHVALALLIGTLLTAMIVQIMLRWHYALTQELGIYLPLLAVNTAVYWNTLRGLDESTTVAALRGAVPGVAIMCALTILIALVRSTLQGSFAALATPFGALLLLSFLIAAIRAWQMRGTANKVTSS